MSTRAKCFSQNCTIGNCKLFICKYNCERCIFVEYLLEWIFFTTRYWFLLFYAISLLLFYCFKNDESNVYMPIDGAKLTHVWIQRMLNSRLPTTAVWFLYLYVGVQFRLESLGWSRGAEEPKCRGTEVPMHRTHNVYCWTGRQANKKYDRSPSSEPESNVAIAMVCAHSVWIGWYAALFRHVGRHAVVWVSILFRTFSDLILTICESRQTGICVYWIDELLHF